MESLIGKLPASFHVPAMACSSLPAALHPHYESIRAHCDPWIRSLVQSSFDPSSAQQLLDSNFPLFCCYSLPHCQDLRRMILYTKLNCWLFISDDNDDDPGSRGSDSSASSLRHLLILDILHGKAEALPTSPCASSKITKGLHALSDLWQETCKDISAGVRGRFIQAMEHYCKAGMQAQARFREASSLPPLDEYIRIRRSASGCIVVFTMMQYALGNVELDDDTLQRKEVAELHNAVIDHICWCNDVMSCRREISKGDYFNLPCIIGATTSCTFQDAMYEAVTMVEQTDKTIVNLVDQIAASDLYTEKPWVESYISGICSFKTGLFTWNYETPRYANDFTTGHLDEAT